MIRSATAHIGFSLPKLATGPAQQINRYRSVVVGSPTDVDASDAETRSIEANREFFATITRRTGTQGTTITAAEMLDLIETDPVAR